jgi:hypothetical protein
MAPIEYCVCVGTFLFMQLLGVERGMAWGIVFSMAGKFRGRLVRAVILTLSL